MSRGAASRRRGPREPTWDEECPGVAVLVEDSERRAERLEAENTRLQDALAEAEAWYRLLQADHASLEARHAQVGRKAAQLQAEADRLGSENRELEALLDRPLGPVQTAGPSKDDTTMNHIKAALRSAGRHKWASAVLVALATLVARDPGVQGLASSALARVRDLGGRDRADAASPSGFVLYAAMAQAREESEKARLDYNQREASLKGDALLEAQDQLRASKARYRQARLAFLPELIHQCQQARLPVPRQAMEEYASLEHEAK
jgi:hypothetical protein